MTPPPHDFRRLILAMLAAGPRPVVTVRASFSPDAHGAYVNLLAEGLVRVTVEDGVITATITDEGLAVLAAMGEGSEP